MLTIYNAFEFNYGSYVVKFFKKIIVELVFDNFFMYF